MIDWRDIAILGFIFILGVALLFAGVITKQNSDRIDILSKRLYDLEQVVKR